MSSRSIPLAVALFALTLLAPRIARADLRIEEQSTALDTTVTRWIAIQGNKRAVVSRAETKGVLYNAGAKYGAYVELDRPDRELIWQVDPQERSYKEVRAEEFTRLLQKGIQAPRTPDDQPLRSLYRSQTTAIEVVPTGVSKRIAGYLAEQVLARVVVGAQNLVSGNQFNFTFDQEYWITKDEQVMKEVQDFQGAYVDAFGTPVGYYQAQLLAGEWNDAFIAHLRAVQDRVRALGGFPLAATTTVTEEAVAQSKNEKSSSRKFVVNTTQVRKLDLESIPDSEFELPVGYINEDTKVAVAAPTSPQNSASTPVSPASPPSPSTVAATGPTTPAVPGGGAGAGNSAVAVKPSPTSVAAAAPSAGGPPAGAGSVAALRPAVASAARGSSVALNPNPASAPGKSQPDLHSSLHPSAPPAVAAAPSTTFPGTAGSSVVGSADPVTAGPRSGHRKPSLASEPEVPTVTGAPTNVIVVGGPGLSNSSRRTSHSASHRQDGQDPGRLALAGVATTSEPPPPVTIDEPAYLTKKGRKHKRDPYLDF